MNFPTWVWLYFGTFGSAGAVLFTLTVWTWMKIQAHEKSPLRTAARWNMVGLMLLFVAAYFACGIGGPPGAKRGPNWETCITHGPGIVRSLLDLKWSKNTLMNVNFPDCAPDEVRGIQITRQGRRDQEVLKIEERHDTWGTPYYWLGFRSRRSNAEEGTDLRAVYDGFVSVTPLSLNLTADDMLEPTRLAFDAG